MTGRDAALLLLILAAITVLEVNCTPAPGRVGYPPGAGYVGTATPTPDPRALVGAVVVRHGPSDAAANAYARLIPTPTPTPTPTPSPTPTLATPVPTAAPQRATGGVSAASDAGGSDLVAIVCAYGWDCPTAMRIVDCESGWDIYAVNSSSGACGLWQHLPCQGYGSASASTALAWEKYQARGWQPWSCF